MINLQNSLQVRRYFYSKQRICTKMACHGNKFIQLPEPFLETWKSYAHQENNYIYNFHMPSFVIHIYLLYIFIGKRERKKMILCALKDFKQKKFDILIAVTHKIQ